MFIDQICQKKKAHWLRPDISEYTINNKYYVKFIELSVFHFTLYSYTKCLLFLYFLISDNEEHIKKNDGYFWVANNWNFNSIT